MEKAFFFLLCIITFSSCDKDKNELGNLINISGNVLADLNLKAEGYEKVPNNQSAIIEWNNDNKVFFSESIINDGKYSFQIPSTNINNSINVLFFNIIENQIQNNDSEIYLSKKFYSDSKQLNLSNTNTIFENIIYSNALSTNGNNVRYAIESVTTTNGNNVRYVVNALSTNGNNVRYAINALSTNGNNVRYALEFLGENGNNVRYSIGALSTNGNNVRYAIEKLDLNENTIRYLIESLSVNNIN